MTLGNHKGYKNIGVGIVNMEWEGNHPIWIGFKMKPTREDPTSNGSDVAISGIFSNIFKERTGHGLNKVVVAMRSDGAVTGVARALGLEAEGCLMHHVNELPSYGVGTLSRRDMMCILSIATVPLPIHFPQVWL
jgi:hypothetical protein